MAFPRKYLGAGAAMMLGAALISQGISTPASAAGSEAKKGDYCTSYESYDRGVALGQVRSCLAWADGEWRIVTHTRALGTHITFAGWIPASPSSPVTWTAQGTVRLSATESVPYRHDKKQTTYNGGYATKVTNSLKCGTYKVTRNYQQDGADAMEQTLNITVACA
ncbi:hypothetical protein ACFYWO_01110 [Streptomyces sp. NPDC002932]|uniref:hypothetical protein n=1 Tax=Streptomyces sp. NPDC002932 TaxID=3364672 RepID=UPI0036C0627C